MSAAAIIGTGLIGRGWAIAFARSGWDVALFDPQEGAAHVGRETIVAQLAMMRQEGLIEDDQAAAGRIKIAEDLSEALDGANYIQENAPEILSVKRDLFTQLDASSGPDAILASSTSTMPASAFTEHLPSRHRCIVAHPVNPTYLIPLVELCGAPWTSPETVQRTREVMLSIAQKPVVLNREIEGFVMNRLQGAVLHEAFRLYSEGIASAEDIDSTIKHGLGLRWAFIGPFETIDLNSPGGIGEYCERYRGVYENIGASLGRTVRWDGQLLADIVAERRAALPAAELKDRMLWRDSELMRLARHLSKPESRDSQAQR